MEFENPISHAADPVTSAEAAEAVTAGGTRERHARRVLALVAAHPGSTAIELQAAQGEPAGGGLTEYQIRRRLTDLLAAGLVAQGDPRPCRVRGSRMVTWRPAGA